MTYQVTVTVEHPARTPIHVRAEGPESHTDESISNKILEAVGEVQGELGVTPTLNEVVASRGTFMALKETFDELGVGPVPGDGMLGAVQRLSMLGNELRQLRSGVGVPQEALREHERQVAELTMQRDASRAQARTYAHVLNEVRRALGVSPQMRDEDLPAVVGQVAREHDRRGSELADLTDDRDRLARHREGLAATVREVREGLGVDQGVFDGQLGKIVALEHETLEMIDRDLHERVHVDVAPGASLAQIAAVRWGAFLTGAEAQLAAEPRQQPLLLERLGLVLNSLGLPSGYWLLKAPLEELRQIVCQVADNSDRWLALTPERLAEAVRWAVLDRAVRSGEISMQSSEPDADIYASALFRWDPDGSREQRQLVGTAAVTLERLAENAPPRPGLATPEHLAQVLFVMSREVSRTRGSEPMPIIEKSGWDEAHPNRRTWWLEVASRTLESLWVVPSQTLLPVTPEQLAKAMHVARSTLSTSGGARPPLFMPTPWEKQGPREKEWFTRVAEIALSELPQIARTDAESDEQFAAHMDASLAELRAEAASLRDEKAEAMAAFRKMSSLLGMSFGGSDDVKAMAMLSLTAVTQLRAERDEIARAGDDANSEMHQYRGVVMWVADQLGIPADQVDDAKLFGDAFREAMKARPTVTLCAPLPEDWMVEFRSTDPGLSDPLWAEVRSGSLLELDGIGTYRVSLRYTGKAGQRPQVSVSPEQLAKAWLEVPTSTGVGFAWGEVPDLHELYREHARQVIERLNTAGWSRHGTVNWSDLARRGRKQGVVLTDVVPGRAYTVDEFGEVCEFKVGKAPEAAPDLPGGKTSFFTDSLEVGPVLSQLREQGEALRRGEKRAERSRQHHRMIAAALGVDGFASPAYVAEKAAAMTAAWNRLREVVGLFGSTEDELVDAVESTFTDFNARIPALIEENRTLKRDNEQFVEDVASALGFGPFTRGTLLETARRVVEFGRKHGNCAGVDALKAEFTRDLAGALDLDPQSEPGRHWRHLLSRVAELIRDDQNVNRLAREHHRELAEALQVDASGWDDLITVARGRSADHAAARQIAENMRRVAAGRSEDLSRALGLNSGETWEDMIEMVTGRTAYDASLIKQASAQELERNAFAEIRRILGLHERLYPAGVVDAVRELESSWATVEGQLLRLLSALRVTDQGTPSVAGKTLDAVGMTGKALDKVRELTSGNAYSQLTGELAEALGMAKSGNWEWQSLLRQVEKFRRSVVPVLVSDDAQDGRRIRDAVLTLLEAAGVDESTNVNAMVQRAGDAAAILRSWPDVLRAVNAFQGEDIEQPDEVAPNLEDYAKKFQWADPPGLFKALERLYAAHAGTVVVDDAGTMYERFDRLVKRLFEPLREIGERFEVTWTPGCSKPQFAEQALTAFRAHEDGIRDGLSAFDIDTPILAEVKPLLEKHAETYHLAGRYQAVLHDLEVLLATASGQPKRFDDASLRERVAQLIDSIFEPVLEVGRVYNIGFEARGSQQGYARGVLMHVRNHIALSPSAIWASFAEQIAAKLESAATLRADADDPDFVQGTRHPEVWHKATLGHAAAVVRAHSAALVSGEQAHPLVMALQDNTFWAPGTGVSELELNPHEDGAVELSNDGVDDALVLSPLELAPVGAALLALSFHHVREAGLKRQREAREAEPIVSAEGAATFAEALGKPLTVFTQTQIWTQGPVAYDPDPGKRWHVGCGGEVTFTDSEVGAGTCLDCLRTCVPEKGAPAITVTRVPGFSIDAAPKDADELPLEWSYGPTDKDPDPGKRWHTGCGQEVHIFDGHAVCSCGENGPES